MSRLFSRAAPWLSRRHAVVRALPCELPRALARNGPMIEEMEPRILHALDNPLLQAGDGGAVAESTPPPIQAPATTVATSTSTSTDTRQASVTQLLIIDTRVDGWQALATDAVAAHPDGSVEVAVLDLDRDGIEQIDALLAAHAGLASVHIVSTGAPGALLLGDTVVDETRLAARADDVAAWHEALIPGGDLLLYGCDVARGADGEAFVDQLARETGLDVAASDDRTGAAARGGDWTLEYTHGAVQAGILFSQAEQASWTGAMDAYVVTNTADSGAGSLRQAILDANAHTQGEPDTISFAIGSGARTITLTSALPTITDVVTIDATSQSGFAGTPLIELKAFGFTLGAGSSGSTIRGFDIDGFGNRTAITVNGSDHDTLAGNWIGITPSGVDSGNSGVRVSIVDSIGTVVGGVNVADRNVISTSGSEGVVITRSAGTLVQGNHIGIDAAGTAAISGGNIGIAVFAGSAGSVIEGNVISGNTTYGVFVNGTGSNSLAIRGNEIGTNAAGSAAVGNFYGIYLVAASNVTIGGADAADANVVSGNNGYGILMIGGSGNTVEGNLIGVRASGAAALRNLASGLVISGRDNVVIGNTISGNAVAGIDIDGAGATGNIVQGNAIGTDMSGTLSLGNGSDGVLIADSASGNTIGGFIAGQGNLIAHNFDGVAITTATPASSGNSIVGNAIYANSHVEIDLGRDGLTPNDGGTSTTVANLGMDAPVITYAALDGTALTIAGYVGSAAGQALFAQARVEFFESTADASGHGGASVYLGYLTTDAAGNYDGTLSTATLHVGGSLSATATDSAGDTSEFGANAVVIARAAPVITSGGGGSTSRVSTAENSAASTTAITTVEASDATPGATLTYSLAGGADASKFTVDASTGALRFVTAPDYETPASAAGTNAYAVTVQVSDGTLSDSQDLTVDVTDIEEAPVITSDGGQPNAVRSIPENTTGVTSVTAIDPDAGTTLVYSIAGGADASKFVIDPSTGTLKFITATDYETPASAAGTSAYAVTVQVSDGTLSDSQDLTVDVTDVEEAPVITSDGGQPNAVRSIPENTTGVTSVTAIDPDAGTTLVYSIAGGADASKFVIDPSTGTLKFITAPDYETPASAAGTHAYAVTVQVSDGTLSDSQDLTVDVTDIEEAPVFTSDGGQPNAVRSIPENTTGVTSVTAIDPDAGTTLVYSIAGGADASKFVIDPSTGTLKFITAPDYETPASAAGTNAYAVTVQVSDGTLSDSQDLTVDVTDVNEAPVITSDGGGPNATLAIDEYTTAVATVHGVDPDAATTLVYGIAGGPDAALFAIDSSSGRLSFVAAPDASVPLDSDRSGIYHVTVQASDSHFAALQKIAVSVLEVEDSSESETEYTYLLSAYGPTPPSHAGAPAWLPDAADAAWLSKWTAAPGKPGLAATVPVAAAADYTALLLPLRSQAIDTVLTDALGSTGLHADDRFAAALDRASPQFVATAPSALQINLRDMATLAAVRVLPATHDADRNEALSANAGGPGSGLSIDFTMGRHDRPTTAAVKHHGIADDESPVDSAVEAQRNRSQLIVDATEGAAASLTVLWSMTQLASLGIGLAGTRANLRAWDPLPVLTRRHDGTVRAAADAPSSAAASARLQPINEEAVLVSRREAS